MTPRRAHRPRAQRPTPMRTPIPPTTLEAAASHESFNPRLFILLRPLRRPQKSQPLCNQQNPVSFCKTPQVGYPQRKYDVRSRASEAQKHSPASPLFASLTHSLLRKSFPCHSYASTRDGCVTPPALRTILGRHRFWSSLSPMVSLSHRILLLLSLVISFASASLA